MFFFVQRVAYYNHAFDPERRSSLAIRSIVCQQMNGNRRVRI
jgi:hypothetical protein